MSNLEPTKEEIDRLIKNLADLPFQPKIQSWWRSLCWGGGYTAAALVLVRFLGVGGAGIMLGVGAVGILVLRKAKKALARAYLEKARKKMATSNYEGAVWALGVVVNICYFALRRQPSMPFSAPTRRFMSKLRSYSEYLVYNWTAYSMLVLCHIELGEFEEAKRKYKILASINPQMADDLIEEINRRLPPSLSASF